MWTTCPRLKVVAQLCPVGNRTHYRSQVQRSTAKPRRDVYKINGTEISTKGTMPNETQKMSIHLTFPLLTDERKSTVGLQRFRLFIFCFRVIIFLSRGKVIFILVASSYRNFWHSVIEEMLEPDTVINSLVRISLFRRSGLHFIFMKETSMLVLTHLQSASASGQSDKSTIHSCLVPNPYRCTGWLKNK